MKFTVEKRLLNEAVTNLQRAVSSKTSIPALEGILICSEENRLILTAYDLEIGMQTELPAIISAPGAIILTAKLFAEIVRRSPDEDITIDVDDRNTATITSGVSCFTIIGMDSAEFPELPKITDADTIKMPQELLKSMIRQTLFAVADSTAKPIHQGSLFKIENGNLDVVSVDGYRLALRREAINYANNTEFVVPGKTLNEISKILSGEVEDQVKIFFTENHIVFEFDDTVVVSRLIEGEYFRIDQMLSSDYETKVKINKREFLECIDRATLFVKEGDKKPIIITIDDTGMQLNINSQMGSMNEEIDIDKEGKDIMIGFNPKFLIDALKVIDDEEISIYLVNPKAPCFIKNEEESYIYLILPVNFNTAR